MSTEVMSANSVSKSSGYGTSHLDSQIPVSFMHRNMIQTSHSRISRDTANIIANVAWLTESFYGTGPNGKEDHAVCGQSLVPQASIDSRNVTRLDLKAD